MKVTPIYYYTILLYTIYYILVLYIEVQTHMQASYNELLLIQTNNNGGRTTSQKVLEKLREINVL